MIINGQAVKGANRLANHLLKQENEKVQVLEISGVATNDNLHEALRDMEVVGALTQSQKGRVLYHANINPKANERLTPEQYIKASDQLMKELGFEGQPRAIVMHQKNGRQHAHLVVQLTDVEKMKLRPVRNNYYKHRVVARELERSLNLTKAPRSHTGKSYSQKEAEQTKKTGHRVKDLRHIVQRIYKHAIDGKTFQQGLNRWGMMLAHGKRLVVLDKNGAPHSLTRMLKSVANASDVKEKVADIAKVLPTVKQGQNSLDIQRRKETDLSSDQDRFHKRLKAGKGYLELTKKQEKLLNQKRGRGYSL